MRLEKSTEELLVQGLWNLGIQRCVYILVVLEDVRFCHGY